MDYIGKDPLEILKGVWGYDSFRENQEEAIEALISQDTDIMYIAKTSSGKSLVYQLPILAIEGMALIVSPLLSLMSDQVSALKEKGINAVEYNSTIGKRTKENIKNRIRDGEIDLLYAAPETLMNPLFLEFLVEEGNIKYIVFDECHTISSYGNDFRPSYKKISILRTVLDVPCIALTATADADTEEDVKNTLKLGEMNHGLLELKQFLDRPSIFYNSIRKTTNSKKQVIDILSQFDKNDTGIIYCTTVKACEALASFLYRQGYSAKPYYSKLKVKQKEEILADWLGNKLNIVVATSAFGMGIDHPSVRFVICYDMPGSVEDLLQAVGRASRDGEPSQAYILHDNKDINLWKFMFQKTVDRSNYKTRINKLNDVVKILRSKKCLRGQIVSYFGQEYPDGNCGSCNNCINYKIK